MKKLTTEEKKQALENALVSFGFPAKYFIYNVNIKPIFCIAVKSEHGGIDTLTRFMPYDEMNSYLHGYNKALTQPFN